MKIYKIDLDMIRQTNGYYLELTEDDYGASQIEITLESEGVAVDLTTATAIEVPFKKPSGTIYVHDLDNGVAITDAAAGKITCTVSTNALDTAGLVWFEVRIFVGLTLSTSAPMRLYVRRPIITDGVITDMDEYPLLQTLIVQCQAITDEEAVRVVQETAREVAEGLRKQGETNRNTAYTTAENARDDAYDAKEDERDGKYALAETARDGLYDGKEADRDNAYNLKEVERDGKYDTAEIARNGLYEGEETERNNAYGLAESGRSDSYADAEDARDVQYGNAESARNDLYAGAEDARDDLYEIAEANRDTIVNSLDARIDTIITTPAESVSAQEIIDARDGEPTLGGKIALKADKTYVDNVTQSLASGSPKGVFALLTDLQADTDANTTDGKKSIYLVSADGKWYYWNGTSWTAGGTYQSTGIAAKSISKVDIAESAIGIEEIEGVTNVNLWNPAFHSGLNIIDDFYLNDGVPSENVNFYISGKISLVAEKEYTVSPVWGGLGSPNVGAFFKEDDTKISVITGATPSTPVTFTTPADTSYVRFSVIWNYNIATAMLVPGASLPESYLPYGAKVGWMRLNDDSVGTDQIIEGSIKLEYMQSESVWIDQFKDGINHNYFDPLAQIDPNIVDNSYVSGTTGFGTSSSYFVSSKIYLKPSETYTTFEFWGAAGAGNRSAFYTAADVCISHNNDATFVMPANAAYIRFTVLKAGSWSTGMIVKGSTYPETQLNYGVEVPWIKQNEIVTAEHDATQVLLSGNRWVGKKMNCIGDSITAVYGGVVLEDTYPVKAGVALGLSVVRNYGIGGSTIGVVSGDTYDPMCVRYADMDDDADIITFSGGSNDVAYVPLGTIDDAVNTTFYGALKILCDGLITKYPDKLIIGIAPPRRTGVTPLSNFTAFAEAFIEVCREYSIPCLDLFHSGGMYPLNATQNTAIIPGGLHPNVAGRQLIAYKLAGIIRAN